MLSDFVELKLAIQFVMDLVVIQCDYQVALVTFSFPVRLHGAVFRLKLDTDIAVGIELY